MKNPFLDKLRDRAGESIAETLVGLLISALALLMLAGALTSASNIVNKSKTAMEDYYTNALNVAATAAPDPSVYNDLFKKLEAGCRPLVEKPDGDTEPEDAGLEPEP